MDRLSQNEIKTEANGVHSEVILPSLREVSDSLITRVQNQCDLGFSHE